ncbi:nuclear transport factor 2 family protein [Nonomuraea longicatena]|uniref:Nuclear transport factor 2 family protein n=1 Tax=Nonomuraea longicatena TaxID=83682 RepID=A0ABP3ZAR4_9ACTN
MTLTDTVHRYLGALEAGDTAAIVELFAPGGQVISPFLGRLAAPAFFTRLAASSRSSRITPIDVLTSAAGGRAVAWFHYRWTLRDGSVLDFDCCDVFDFAAGSARVALLTIVYDTAPIRAQVGDKYA